MEKPEVVKRFKSGKCQICHSPEFLKRRKLCPACENYASQGHVYLRAIPIGSAVMDDWIENSSDPSSWQERHDCFDLEFYRERFYQLLRNTGLTAQQRQIVRLFFCENLSRTQISKKLEVSHSSVSTQLKRALEKLKTCHENPVLVKERALRTPRPRPIRPKSSTEKEKILPVKIFQPDENGNLRLTQIVYPTKRKHFPRRPRKMSVYENCGRCGAKAFLVDQDFYYCMDCSWNSDTHGGLTVSEERKLNSYEEKTNEVKPCHQ